jgi:pentatricopeptide repeat protein
MLRFLFLGKMGYGLLPEAVGVVNILPVCGFLGLGLHGKHVHGFRIRTGLVDDVFVGNALVDMYAKCGEMRDADKVFERMLLLGMLWLLVILKLVDLSFEDALSLFGKMREEKIELDVVTWSSVISGYAQKGLGREEMDVFREMCGCGCRPNVVTLISLLSGCASVGALLHGKETHYYAIKFILKGENDGDDLMVINALIDMYAKCKSLMKYVPKIGMW